MLIESDSLFVFHDQTAETRVPLTQGIGPGCHGTRQGAEVRVRECVWRGTDEGVSVCCFVSSEAQHLQSHRILYYDWQMHR